MKKLIYVFLAVFVFTSVSLAATPVTVDLEKLPETARSQVLNELEKESKKKKSNSIELKDLRDINPEDIQKWGRAIASGVKETANVLNVEVNEFIKTPVGKGTAFLVFWKFIGKDAWNGMRVTLFLTIFMIIFNIILYRMAKIFLIPKNDKVTVKWAAQEQKAKENFSKKTKIPLSKFKDSETVTFNTKVDPYEWGDDYCKNFVAVLYMIVVFITNVIFICNIV